MYSPEIPKLLKNYENISHKIVFNWARHQMSDSNLEWNACWDFDLAWRNDEIKLFSPVYSLSMCHE